MKVTVISTITKATKFGAPMTTVTTENDNGKTQYFQLAPWHYKAAGLEAIQLTAIKAVKGQTYDISFQVTQLKGRPVTLLTSFNKIDAIQGDTSAQEEALFSKVDAMLEETAQAVVETPVTVDDLSYDYPLFNDGSIDLSAPVQPMKSLEDIMNEPVKPFVSKFKKAKPAPVQTIKVAEVEVQGPLTPVINKDMQDDYNNSTGETITANGSVISFDDEIVNMDTGLIIEHKPVAVEKVDHVATMANADTAFNDNWDDEEAPF